MGLFPGLRLRRDGPRLHGLHGTRQLRPEALQAHHDGDLRRGGPRQPDGSHAGRRNILEEHPDSPGSLGIAISEAIEDAVKNDDAKYSLGSVLNHVLLHQTVIGQEALQQMELAGEYPDVVVGCVGGGSNFGGVAFPFIRENLKNGKNAHRGRRACLMPHAHEGPLHLRFWRYRRHHPDDEDVHAGTRSSRAESMPGLALPRRLPIVSALAHEGLIERGPTPRTPPSRPGSRSPGRRVSCLRPR